MMAKDKMQGRKAIPNITGIFSDIDIHFARFIERFSPTENPDVFLAAALVSRATDSGDICLDLEAVAETRIIEKQDGAAAVVGPPLDIWRRQLISSPAVGNPGDPCPLILDGRNRLYLYRYWEYENKLSRAIRQRSAGELQDFNFLEVAHSLRRLFPPTTEDEVNWQEIAAVIALLKRFSVITGGPGSGKTFTIARTLALLLECGRKEKMKICLAAPTGKAAARLAAVMGSISPALLSPSVRSTMILLSLLDSRRRLTPLAIAMPMAVPSST